MANKTSKSKRVKKDSKRVNQHKSFKRSYREDYKRKLEVPGMMYHIFASFKIIFKNWKLFLPFLVLMVVVDIFFVGMMSESTYVGFQDVLDETSMQVNPRCYNIGGHFILSQLYSLRKTVIGTPL